VFGPWPNSEFIRETQTVLLGPSMASLDQTSSEGGCSAETGGCVLRPSYAIDFITFANRKTRNILLSAAALAACLAGHDGKNCWP